MPREFGKILRNNENVSSGATDEVDVYAHHYLEILGNETGGTTGTISFQRSVNGTDFYTTETINVVPSTAIYFKTEVIQKYARLLYNNNFTGLTIGYSALSYFDE